MGLGQTFVTIEAYLCDYRHGFEYRVCDLVQEPIFHEHLPPAITEAEPGVSSQGIVLAPGRKPTQQ